MSSASNYIENAILNCILRGVPMPTYPKTYIALFTGNPGEAGSLANEVSTTIWPSYVRREAEQGGAIGSGWTEPVSGSSSNANQITFPAHNGAAALTITHYAIMDAATGGNIVGGYAPLQTARTMEPGDIFVFDVGTMLATQD